MNNITHYRYEREYPLFGNSYGIELVTFETIKETDKGYWLKEKGIISSYKKFVLKKSKKRYAYPSKEEALKNFIKRTISCKKYAEDNLKNAEKFLEVANNFKII